ILAFSACLGLGLAMSAGAESLASFLAAHATPQVLPTPGQVPHSGTRSFKLSAPARTEKKARFFALTPTPQPSPLPVKGLPAGWKVKPWRTPVGTPSPLKNLYRDPAAT